MGDFKVEIDVLFCDNNFFFDEFFDVVLCSVGLQDWLFVKEDEVVFFVCCDYCEENVFMIDYNGVVELGNVIYVKFCFDGKIDIVIYVFDVVYFIKVNFLVDCEVKK